MCPTYFIRQAERTEYEALCVLFEELDEHHRLERPDLFRKPLSERRDRAVLDELIAKEDRTILVADEDGKSLLGLAVLSAKISPESVMRESRQYVELVELVVRPSTRRAGIGRALVEASKIWTQSRGLSELDVTALSFNMEAISFYRKIGFQPQLERFTMVLR